MKKYFIGTMVIVTVFLVACNNVKPPKNIILMIGDGMGISHTTAYRYYSDLPSTINVETTIFDQILVGTARNYPDDSTYITDSAAGATALATGHKTYNGAIGINRNKDELETVLERAKKVGKKTALLSTSQINHATPASFAAHNISRQNYNEIADEYLDSHINGRPKVDLLLGGGTQYFIRDDRNLVNEFNEFGYQYVDDLSKIDEIKNLPALGLFASVGLAYEIDSKEKNRLQKMTSKALELLRTSGNGFFMMVEGSQIDWCSHQNDIACAMNEMDDFAKSVEIVKKFVDESREDTLLIVTSDHSTGGLYL
jgi:alkaline phosphatase